MYKLPHKRCGKGKQTKMKQTNIVGKCKTCQKNIRNYFYDDDPNEYRECHCKYYRYDK